MKTFFMDSLYPIARALNQAVFCPVYDSIVFMKSATSRVSVLDITHLDICQCAYSPGNMPPVVAMRHYVRTVIPLHPLVIEYEQDHGMGNALCPEDFP